MSRYIENFNELIKIYRKNWKYNYYNEREVVKEDLKSIINSKGFYEKKYLKYREHCCKLLTILKVAIEDFIIFKYIDGEFFTETEIEQIIDLLASGIYINNIEKIDDILDLEEDDLDLDKDDPATQILALLIRIEMEISDREWKENQIDSINCFLHEINCFKEKLIVNTFKFTNIYYNITRKSDINNLEYNKNNYAYIDDIYTQIEKEIEYIYKIQNCCEKYESNPYISMVLEKINEINFDEVIINIESELNINLEENREKYLNKKINDKNRKYSSRRDENGLTKKQLELQLERKEALRLYQVGYSKSRIAKEMNISKSKVISLLKGAKLDVQK